MKRGRPNKLIFEAGKTYKNLTTISVSGKAKSGDILWKCLCICGNYKDVRASHLVRNEVKSCGCLGIKYSKLERNDKYHFDRYKKSARKRKIDFHLPYENFVKLTNSNCHYCNSPPSYKFLYKNSFNANGIDRINSNLRIFN